jgi:negative elongation factor B
LNIVFFSYRYVKYIVEHEQIYSRAPIELKRLIWTDNHTLFQKELQPIISQYLINVEEQLLQCDHNYFLQLPKQRRQTSPTIQSLLHMIGTNIKLYDIVRTSLQKLFQRTKIVHYSSLRLLLLMAFHDLENNSVSKSDSIHIFVWTLDAALKERKLDVKKQREIEQFLDAHARDTDIINKHIPFVLTDPNIVSILAKSCVLLLHKQVNSDFNIGLSYLIECSIH